MNSPLVRLAIVVGLAVLAYVGFRVWKSWSLRRSTRLVQAMGTPDRLTLMYFAGPNCAQCGAQEAAIAQLAADNSDVLVESYDASIDVEVAARVGVMSVPTTVIVDETGRVVARNGRLVKAAVLRGQLEAARSGSARAS